MSEVINKDEEHLRLLSIFYYIVGGMTCLFAFFPVIHLVIGIIAIISPEKLADKSGNLPPPFFGWMFAIIGGVAILLGLAYAICLIIAGKFIARRIHYVFCLVMAGFGCLSIPFGTVLGIFTFIILSRPQVKEMFVPKST